MARIEVADVDYPAEPTGVLNWYELTPPAPRSEHRFHGVSLYANPANNYVVAIERAGNDSFLIGVCKFQRYEPGEWEYSEHVSTSEEAERHARNMMTNYQ